MLEQNYRSTAQIVEAADRFIQRNQKPSSQAHGSGPWLWGGYSGH